MSNYTPLPVLSVAQMREWEKAAWAAGQSEHQVIQQVGRLLARRLLELTRPGDAIWIIAGTGHNGDDARAAQPHLLERNVLLMNVTDPAQGLTEFSHRLQTRGVARVRWIVDALFGLGLNRPLDADWQKLIGAINGCGIPILAVDVPSGLNADTGAVEGAAIQAALTWTVGAPKTGLLKAPAFTGRLEVAPEIGLGPCPHSSELNWTLPEDFASLPPRRKVDGNKGDNGHLAIFAGSVGYHGAAVLAARGALRAQPGLVTVYPHPSAYGPVAAQLQSAMVHPWTPGQPLPKTCTAVLIGPGLAMDDLPETLKAEMRSLWRYSLLAMIVDASALNWLETRPPPPDAVRLITPHPGEAGRLLACSTQEVQADRVAALRRLSKRFGDCCVALKGHQTLVGRAAGNIFVNNSGNPFLAQGGSGDLLAGYVAGLLAQPAWRQDPLLAVRYAVWQHGAAADHLSDTLPNWTVEDLAAWLGRINPSSANGVHDLNLNPNPNPNPAPPSPRD
jgi:NAD(P)H-hydrate epimerase